jgi:hypothetical protein
MTLRNADGPPASGERRSSQRFRLRLPIELHDWWDCSEAATHNISESGVRIEGGDRRLLPGAKVTVVLRPSPDASPLELCGVVVRETETGGVGVRFEKLDPVSRERLCELLRSLSEVAAA